jgi:hypothetical protein
MKILQKIAAVIAAAGSMAALAPRASAHYERTYFPMHVGNQWVYSYQNRLDPQTTTKTVSVDASYFESTSGTLWFRMRGYNGDYHWLRYTSIGRVYEWRSRQWYRLGAAPGYKWTMSILDDAAHGAIECSQGAKLEVVSRNESVTVPAGTFSTIHIRFATACNDAGITDEWFAQGVGLVRRETETIGGPAVWALDHATISGKAIGGGAATNAVDISVATDQSSYYEDHMPTIGTPQRSGATVKITARIVPQSGRDTTLNFTDFNTWNVEIVDASGNVVWSNPKLRAMAPAGGVNRQIPGAGESYDFSAQLPYGTAQGTYTVRATLLLSNNRPAPVTTTFDYDWTF